MPTQPAFEAAVKAAAPAARSLGVTIQTGSLWSVLLRRRVPLLAVRHGSHCHIGYGSYTPGQDFTDFFPPLPAAQARIWLEGLVHHELAHCAQVTVVAIDGRASGKGEALDRARRQESMADLGFAAYVEQADAGGLDLVRRLLLVREKRAAVDPQHDTRAALRCYLAHPARLATAARHDISDPQGAWLAALRTWAERCLPENPG